MAQDAELTPLPGLEGFDDDTAVATLEALFKCARGYVVYRLRKLPLEVTPLGGEVAVVSPSIREVMGVDDPEKLEQWFRLVHPDDMPRVMASQLACHQQDVPFDEVFRLEVRGETRWIHAISHPTFDASGEATHFNGIVIDVTDRVRAEREAQRLSEQIDALQRVESLGTLATAAAHDFNNVLQALAMTLGLVRNRSSEGDLSLFGEIDDIVERGATLTRDLLAYARRTPPGAAPEDVRPHIDRIARLVQRMFPQAMVETALPDVSLAARISPGALDQILLNLGINAAQAAGDGGTVRFEARRCSAEEASRLAGLPKTEGAVVLDVVDDGPTIPADAAARLFEAGFTTKADVGGTGLGLATVKRLVERSGGQVGLVEEGPKAFRCLLPVASPMAVLPERVVSEPGETVLVVDDDAMFLRSLILYLEGHGFEARGAESYVEALSRWHRDPHRFGWVITDSILPGRGGVDLVRHMRAMSPELAVVLLSGDADAPSHAELSGLPRTLLLEKPFEPAELVDVLRRLRAGTKHP